MAINLDTEQRMDRAVACLDAVQDLCSFTPADERISAEGMAQLLSLIGDELRAAWPKAALRRYGANSNDV